MLRIYCEMYTLIMVQLQTTVDSTSETLQRLWMKESEVSLIVTFVPWRKTRARTWSLPIVRIRTITRRTYTRASTRSTNSRSLAYRLYTDMYMNHTNKQTFSALWDKAASWSTYADNPSRRGWTYNETLHL